MNSCREQSDGPQTDITSAHITPSGGNIFEDLGFPREEALRLKAKSDVLIQESDMRQRKEMASNLGTSDIRGEGCDVNGEAPG